MRYKHLKYMRSIILLKPYTKERFAKSIERLEKGDMDVSGLAQSVIMDKEDYPERVSGATKQKIDYNCPLVILSG